MSMKYETLRIYVGFFRSKLFKFIFLSLYAWPVVGGYLDYSDVLPSTLWLNLTIGVFGSLLIVCTPRRRRVLRNIASKPTPKGWRRRSCPKCELILGHFYGPFIAFWYALFANAEATVLLPALAFFAVFFTLTILLFWRPLVVRFLFGFDKRTKVFGLLG
ncbi:MAG: hypothetical protein RLN85_06365 [Pseudomonadales bacterium]